VKQTKKRFLIKLTESKAYASADDADSFLFNEPMMSEDQVLEGIKCMREKQIAREISQRLEAVMDFSTHRDNADRSKRLFSTMNNNL